MALLMTLSMTTSSVFYEPRRKARIIIRRPSEIHQRRDALRKAEEEEEGEKEEGDESPPGKWDTLAYR